MSKRPEKPKRASKAGKELDASNPQEVCQACFFVQWLVSEAEIIMLNIREREREREKGRRELLERKGGHYIHIVCQICAALKLYVDLVWFQESTCRNYTLGIDRTLLCSVTMSQ